MRPTGNGEPTGATHLEPFGRYTMKTSAILSSLVLLSSIASPAMATEPFRPWLQAHWEVDEGSGLPTQAMSTGSFRPWLQAHWEVDEGSGLPTQAMAFGSFRPWQQAHWEVADEAAPRVDGLAAGDLAGR
jgi:hypothetical protein